MSRILLFLLCLLLVGCSLSESKPQQEDASVQISQNNSQRTGFWVSQDVLCSDKPIPTRYGFPKASLVDSQKILFDTIEEQMTRVEKSIPENDAIRAITSRKLSAEYEKLYNDFAAAGKLFRWIGQIHFPSDQREINVKITFGIATKWEGPCYTASPLYDVDFAGDGYVDKGVSLAGIKEGDWVEIDADIEGWHSPSVGFSYFRRADESQRPDVTGGSFKGILLRSVKRISQ